MTWLDSAVALLCGRPRGRPMSPTRPNDSRGRGPGEGDASRPAHPSDRAGEIVLAVHEELRGIASSYLQRERANHTLQTTALVHEAYLRLAQRSDIVAASRDEYLAVAAQAVRRILVDHARRKGAQKRDGAREDVDLERALDVASPALDDLPALDAALSKLATLHARQARIVELRFFAGLEMDEVARLVGVSPRTAAADWVMARTWLHAELSREGSR
jgi:RNA polymerase sigma factor (TIGR02999 family)